MLCVTLLYGTNAWADTYEVLYGIQQADNSVLPQTDFTGDPNEITDVVFSDANGANCANAMPIGGSCLYANKTSGWNKDFEEPVTDGKVYYSCNYTVSANNSKTFKIVTSTGYEVYASSQQTTNGNATQVVAYICGTEVSSWVRQARKCAYGVKSLVIDLDKGIITYELLASSGNNSYSTLTGTVNIPAEVTDIKGLHVEKTDYGAYLDNVVLYAQRSGVTKYDYTINYLYNGDIIKTVSNKAVEDATILADMIVSITEGEGEEEVTTTYFTVESEAPSMTISASGENVLNVDVRLPFTATLSISKNIGGNTITDEKTLIEPTSRSTYWEYGFSKYEKNDDTYYLCDETEFFESGEFIDGEIIDISRNYSTEASNVIAFLEAENGGVYPATGNEYSGGKIAAVGAQNKQGRGLSFGVIPAGSYELTVSVISNEGRGIVIRKKTEDNTEATKFAEIYAKGMQSSIFELTEDTEIVLAGKDSGEKTNQSADFDYALLSKLGGKYSYTLTAISEDKAVNKVLAKGEWYEGKKVTIPYAKYYNIKGTLYQADGQGDKKNEYNYSITIPSKNIDATITYKPTSITEVAMFTEGEDIEGITKNTNGNIAIRASQSAAGYAADGDVTVGTIATGGTYKMVAQLAGSGKNGETTFAFAANGTTVFEPVLGAKSNLGGGTSERFSVQDGATITLAQGGDANSAVDFVYVYKVEDFNIAEDAEYFAKSTEQNPNDGVLSNHLIGKDGSTFEVTSDKENAGAIWMDTWMEDDNEKQFVDLRIQKDGAFIISTSSSSLSLRKIVFTGAALQMTPSDGQFEGQAASRVNKAAPAMVTKTWTGNIDKVKFWADSLVRISTIKLYVEASDGNTATYEDKPRPDQPAKPDLQVAADIAAFKALADSTEAKLTLTDAVVTFVNGKNIYLEDATGAIVLYDMGLELTEGQKLNGLLAGKTVNYFALPEMVKTDSTKTDTFTAEAGEVKATTMALADICKVENLARLITISNVTIDVVDNNIFATSGDEKLQVYNKFKVDGLDLQKGNVYTSITGILVPWQNKETLEITYELAPRTLADLVLDADATGISELAGEKAAREVYNLNGQRVNTTKKGLYIINGKKVMVK